MKGTAFCSSLNSKSKFGRTFSRGVKATNAFADNLRVFHIGLLALIFKYGMNTASIVSSSPGAGYNRASNSRMGYKLGSMKNLKRNSQTILSTYF